MTLIVLKNTSFELENRIQWILGLVTNLVSGKSVTKSRHVTTVPIRKTRFLLTLENLIQLSGFSKLKNDRYIIGKA